MQLPAWLHYVEERSVRGIAAAVFLRIYTFKTGEEGSAVNLRDAPWIRGSSAKFRSEAIIAVD